MYQIYIYIFLLFSRSEVPSPYMIIVNKIAIGFVSTLFSFFYAQSSNGNYVQRGGSIRKSRELKTRMKTVNTMSDLQGSAFRPTSVICSSRPVLEDVSSNCSVGHVKKPYAIPVKAAPKCVLPLSMNNFYFHSILISNSMKSMNEFCFPTIFMLKQYDI